ncbi:glutathionyl-hydroquinone reductase [Malassezia cuniculi]|uniref:Glutathionyl-hydroquinone reductase n=1 Tax=Malassezia cuniculi TaxID=948313 RepID=A0AAF0ER27_9BASI|nr:glutathionyl-hydroquinone reductase [Malassezia cuniculi]
MKPSFSFGGTSSNTASTSAPSLFGAQQKPGGFSFGGSQNSSTAAPTQKPAGSLFGTQSTGAAGSATGNSAAGVLFGQNNTTNTTNTTGGLFGQNNANTGTSAGGLFGQNTSNSGTSGGLFGQNNAGATGATGNLFGQNTTGAANTTTTTGNLFGQSTTGTGTTAGTAGGLFGQNNNNNTSGTTGGLFGQNNTNTAGTTGSLFGQTNTGATGNLFGQSTNTTGGLFGQNNNASGGLFGQNNAAKPASGNAMPFLQYPFYQRERFNDLPEQQRKMFEELDAFITSQTKIRGELRARDPGTEINRLVSDWHDLETVLQSLEASLEADSIRMQTVASKVERDRNDNVMLYDVARHSKDRLSDGSSFVHWLNRFYEDAAEQYVARIHRYRANMEQIERHLAFGQKTQMAPHVIAEIIHDQNSSFMALAEQVATLHAEIDVLKKDYAKWYRARFQSVRDPFAQGVSAADHS